MGLKEEAIPNNFEIHGSLPDRIPTVCYKIYFKINLSYE